MGRPREHRTKSRTRRERGQHGGRADQGAYRDGPVAGSYPVWSGEAELSRDIDRRNAWLLALDGVPQSHVDLDDPTYLAFDYVQHIGAAIDCLAEPGRALHVTHIGGGACTLARYIAAKRPGSRQLVFEPDGELVAMVRDQLALRSVRGLRVRVTDGRSGVSQQRDATADLVIVDAFDGSALASDLLTIESLQRLHRLLRPDGICVLNIADGPGLSFCRRVAATVRASFDHHALLAEPGVLRGRRFGNVVLVASKVTVPITALARRTAGVSFPARCLDETELARFCASARPLTDAAGVPAPAPPAGVFR